MGGKEITTPICFYEDLKSYIIAIANIIDENGETNEDTGLHIHISTIDESAEVDFYKFMLLCDDTSLLQNWGRVWNLEKRKENDKMNHIEIRTIGGTHYQRKIDQILNELDQFIKIFNRSIKDSGDDKEYVTILEEHMEVLKSASPERREKFLQLLS